MRSKMLRSLVLPVAFSLLSGCAFTQWTDHAFIGSPSDPPTHPNREWAGAVILPLAVTGDILTTPIQLVMLLIMKDDGIYAAWNKPKQARRDPLPGEAKTRLAMTGDASADRLLAEVDARLAEQGAGAAHATAWGIDAEGNVTAVSLSADQRARLLARADAGGAMVVTN